MPTKEGRGNITTGIRRRIARRLVRKRPVRASGVHLLVVLVAAIIGTAGCRSDAAGPTLFNNSASKDDWVYALPEEREVNTPYVVATRSLCVHDGSATVDNVVMDNPNGPIRLLDWGIHRATVASELLAPGTLQRQSGISQTGLVTAKCGDGIYLDELYVVVKIVSARAGRINGFNVTYTSAGKSREMIDRFVLGLSPPGDPYPKDWIDHPIGEIETSSP